MWGVVPAAGIGSRIQPLAFSKELLPVGSTVEDGGDRPRAVSEYLVERMVVGGATKICFVIAPGKSDIVEYYGAGSPVTPVCYVVQPEPNGLCDAIFRALPLVDDAEAVLVGLPDTIWFPEDGLAMLGEEDLSFLCFPVEEPERFDAVVSDESGSVVEIQVKQQGATSHWVWGAFKVRGRTLRELHALWLERGSKDPYVGTLVNAWLAQGHRATAVRYGRAYVDTGTIHGYREAIQLVDGTRRDQTQRPGARVANGRRGFPTPAGAR
ncbi:MAG: Glucose-phosphate thymidylyltransferase [Labilithrix sp.]|nr:Glucose-phosphate thymidylyltransferase [Labilithrix sp.]